MTTSGGVWRERLRRFAFRAVLTTTAILPLLVDPSAKEAFTAPKDAVFRAVGILVLFGFAILVCWHPKSTAVVRRHWLATAIAVWAAVVTIASTNPVASSYTLVSILSAVAFYVAASELGHSSAGTAAAIVLPAALVNALVFALQKSGYWNPFLSGVDVSKLDAASAAVVSDCALLGNRDYVATYLVLPLFVAFVLGTTTAAKRIRVACFTASAILCAAILASKVITAIAALAITAVVIAFARSARMGFAAIGVAAGLIVASAAVYPALRHEAAAKIEPLMAGKVGSRAVTTAAALRMVADHPLTGVGPGRFGWAFYPEKLIVQRELRNRLSTFEYQNFGEAHNDHVQLMAEGGVVAYLLFVGAMIALAAPNPLKPWRAATASPAPRTLVAERLRLPLLVSLFILMIAQFPLQITPVLANYSVLAGLVGAWRTS